MYYRDILCNDMILHLYIHFDLHVPGSHILLFSSTKDSVNKILLEQWKIEIICCNLLILSCNIN